MAISQRLASEASLSAFSRPCFASTLPGTTVRARTSSSGEVSASMMAMASSVPGSVSMMTFWGPAAGDGTEAEERFPARAVGIMDNRKGEGGTTKNTKNEPMKQMSVHWSLGGGR